MVMPDGNEVTVCRDYTLKIRPSEPEKINIFCMYALRPLIEGTFPVNKKNKRFGDYALILMNRGEFIQRLESSLKSQRIVGDAGLVEYVNDEHAGKLGPLKIRGKLLRNTDRLVTDFAQLVTFFCTQRTPKRMSNPKLIDSARGRRVNGN